jgi:hypothetical protein
MWIEDKSEKKLEQVATEVNFVILQKGGNYHHCREMGGGGYGIPTDI